MTDEKQALLQHLEELRWRLLAIIIFLLCSFLLSLFFADDLYAYITSQFDQKLLVLGPNDILWIYVSLASLMAVTLSLPFGAYQIWAFVRRGLTDREARAILIFVPAVFFSFLAGLAFGFYLVSPALLQVLLGIGENLFQTQLTAQNYLAFLYHTSLPMAFLFEGPVLVAFLTSLGLLNPRWLVAYRRQAYFSLIVLAVLITPADLLSDLVMTLPLIGLFELAIGLSYLISKRKHARKEN